MRPDLIACVPFGPPASVVKTPALPLSWQPLPTGARLPGGCFPPGPPGKGRIRYPCLCGWQDRFSGFDIIAPAFTIRGLKPPAGSRRYVPVAAFLSMTPAPGRSSGLFPPQIQSEWVFTPETAPGHHRTGPSRGIRRQGSDTLRMVSPHLELLVRQPCGGVVSNWTYQ